MSYCRFIEADAYIYDDVDYGLYCCVCSLMPMRTFYNDFLGMDVSLNEGFVAGDDYDKMLAHIADHRAAGEFIPKDVDEQLIKERDCEHKWVEKINFTYCGKCGAAKR